MGLSNSPVGSKDVDTGLTSAFVGVCMCLLGGLFSLLFKWGEFHFSTCRLAWSLLENLWSASSMHQSHMRKVVCALCSRTHALLRLLSNLLFISIWGVKEWEEEDGAFTLIFCDHGQKMLSAPLPLSAFYFPRPKNRLERKLPLKRTLVPPQNSVS